MIRFSFAASVLLCIAPTAPAAEVEKITAERVGLPATNGRSSEPFVVRIYKGDDISVNKRQPKGYPQTLKEDYKLQADETVRVHYGVDLQSRLTPGSLPTPLDFNAGVNGVVVDAGNNSLGLIAVALHDGTVVQYLHTSQSYVKRGDIVAPDTKLGKTGDKQAGAIHLHVQAKRNGRPISPDLAFQIGKRKLESKPEPQLPDDAVFDPDLFGPVEPTIVDGVVRARATPKTKWVVEVIGMGGRVDEVLGEFYTYESASHCATTWSNSRPDDLRLTREREVPLKP